MIRDHKVEISIALDDRWRPAEDGYTSLLLVIRVLLIRAAIFIRVDFLRFALQAAVELINR